MAAFASPKYRCVKVPVDRSFLPTMVSHKLMYQTMLTAHTQGDLK